MGGVEGLGKVAPPAGVPVYQHPHAKRDGKYDRQQSGRRVSCKTERNKKNAHFYLFFIQTAVPCKGIFFIISAIVVGCDGAAWHGGWSPRGNRNEQSVSVCHRL